MSRVRARLIRDARVALIAAIVACAITMAFASLFDPFGREASRAQQVATGVAAFNLCISRDTFSAVASLIEEGTPARIILDNSVVRLEQAGEDLGINCPVVKATGPK